MSLFFLSVVSIVHYFFPVVYIYLIAEDGLLEYGTFAFFIFAAALMGRLLFQDTSSRKLGYFLFLGFLFFIAMEEISWGERIIPQIQGPWLIRNRNLQGEFNLHNLPEFNYRIADTFVGILLIWGISFPLLAHWLTKVRLLSNRFGVPLVPLPLLPYFIFVLFLKQTQSIVKNGELAEFFFGFAILCVVGALSTEANVKWLFGQSFRSQSFGLFILFIILTGTLSSFFPNRDNLRYRIHYAAMEAYPEAGMLRQAETLFAYIIKQSDLVETKTWVAYGDLLIKQGKREEPIRVLKKALEAIEKDEQEHPNSDKTASLKRKTYSLLQYENRNFKRPF